MVNPTTCARCGHQLKNHRGDGCQVGRPGRPAGWLCQCPHFEREVLAGETTEV